MVVWLGAQSHELAARGRDVLDGAIVAGSLLVLSWVTALGTVVSDGGAWLSLTLSLAYPLSDLILGTLALMALARGAVGERLTLVLLAVGLGGLAFSDSAYVYLVSQGAYTSADLVSSGWVFGFLMVAAAAATVLPTHGVETDRPVGTYSRDGVAPSVLRLALPYLPLLAAMGALGASLLSSPTPQAVDLLLGVALILLVLIRQLLAMVDNLRLILAVQVAHDELHHQASHDALTGLANRVLFADRLDRALLEPSTRVSVLFCDLDDFKQVNDAFGHESGDLLLRSVADRLLECVRVTDTVTRLGGDEFAILLTDSSDAVQVAERVVSLLGQPLEIDGQVVRTSVSIGLAHHQGTLTPPDDRRDGDSRLTPLGPSAGPDAASTRAATARLLLRTADTAMYVAKGAGKGRVVFAESAEAEAEAPAPSVLAV